MSDAIATAPRKSVKKALESPPSENHKPADPKAALGKVLAARDEFNRRMLDRSAEIDALLIALLSGENALLVGPPGTAKSMLSDAITELVHGTRFTLLMTKFTTPDEVFGPISLQSLKADTYKRLTDGYLPSADVAFLDEIFKSSSAILNTLLKLLNEGTYTNGKDVVKCPLTMTVAASNEWPVGEGQQELGALFDRFLIRRTVRPVSPANREKLLFHALPNTPITPLSPEELKAVRWAVSNLPWSDDARKAMMNAISALAHEGIVPGDRRQRKAVNVVRAAAYLAGDAQVEPRHLSVLADVLWDEPLEQPKKAAQVITRIADPDKARIMELLAEAEEVRVGCDIHQLDQVTAATAKLQVIEKALRVISDPTAGEAMALVAKQRNELRAAALDAKT